MARQNVAAQALPLRRTENPPVLLTLRGKRNTISPETTIMARLNNGPFGFSPGTFQGQALTHLDASVASTFFTQVYAWMSAGLAVTAAVAYAVANTSLNHWAMSMPVLIVSFIVEMVLVVTISSAINRISAPMAIALFMLYSALNGIVLSVLFMIYTRASLGGTFIITAGAFGAMSVYGYTTKRDLTRIGSFLFMGLIGIILASVVNFFWHNPMLYWLISYAGVLIFVGLTAFDTQRLRYIASQTENDPRLASRMAVVGSLTLYLDFINLFLMLLRVMGNRRGD
jgi:FtsH-binding integral membrane protein